MKILASFKFTEENEEVVAVDKLSKGKKEMKLMNEIKQKESSASVRGEKSNQKLQSELYKLKVR